MLDKVGNIIGLDVYRRPGFSLDWVKLEDLADWIEARDAACAEYLADAIKEYNALPEDDDRQPGAN